MLSCTTTKGEQNYTTRETCRVCRSRILTPLFSLGEQYVSDFLNPGDDPGIKVPIELELCRYCTLVQAKHTAPQDFLYSRQYWYRSSATQTMRDALANVTHDIEALIHIEPDDVVLDIGSNDGCLLRSYSVPCRRVGVEPADNMVAYYDDDTDITLIHDFWSHRVLRKAVPDKYAKVITALGMFYDLEDPNQFIEDVRDALAPDGIFVAQLMCLRNMLDINDVGNLAHEHLLFYSLQSLRYLFGSHGLEIMDIQRNNVNGQSYRIYARHCGSRVKAYGGSDSRIYQYEALEQELGDPAYYKRFFSELEANKLAIQRLIKDVTANGKKVWVYGASTKGNVILQWLELDHTLIEGAVDRSPEKWGKVTVGTNIPIYSNEEGRKANPDFFLCLPYAFLPEFQKLEEDWHRRGGRFIVPLPRLRIV